MTEDTQGWKRWPLRHRAAAAILTALPLLAVGGALLPNVVELSALRSIGAESTRAAVEPLRAADEILVPRSFWTEVVPELNELASLFVDAASLSQTIAKVRSITGILATERDLLLLPDDLLRANSLETAVVSATPPVGAPGQMTPVLEDRCQGNIFCFLGEAELSAMSLDAMNTFVGSGGGETPVAVNTMPIPEPSSATLMVLGLLVLAGMRRRA